VQWTERAARMIAGFLISVVTYERCRAVPWKA